MTRRFLTSTTVAALTFVLAATQGSRAADPARLKTNIATLASERFGGRLTGTDGERLAREFIVSELKRIGAKPLPGQRDFALPFEFTAGARDAGTTLSVAGKARALAFSDSGEASGGVVFAGYGLVVPESQNLGYDSYAALDVKDKIVVVLRYFPEDTDEKTRAILARYSDLRYKAMAARQRGAKALLVVTGPRSPNAGQLAPMSFDTALAGSGIPGASITGPVADALFTSKPLRDIQQELDTGNPHVAGFDFAGVMLTLTTSIVRERHTGRNVVAYLPATGPVTAQKPWVIIGAHYDHLGRGGRGNSLASKEELSGIHHGADDNASGTAAVLAIAEAIARSPQPRRRHVVVGLWSAEEIGLVGSNAFVTNPPMPIDQIAAYFNFDMVGRMQDNRLIVQATGTSPVWGRLLERANVAAGFDLAVQPDPYQPSDVASFNQAGVPCLFFFTGSHVDYHKPSDTADKINYEDLDRIVTMTASLVRTVADTDEAPQFTKVDQPVSRGASLAGVRVTTGTIPDYATEVKGLLLSGVVGGGPAEAAGLMKGDIIVEIAGQTIANIYDYTYALELLRVNQPVKVVYTRNGEKRETQLTPAGRR